MLPEYPNMLEAAGAIPLILPLTTHTDILDHCLTLCHGLLLTGGHDVSPTLYGATPTPQCGTPCPERDKMEWHLLNKAIHSNKPLLAICRGIQLINVFFGGTLYQDIPTEHPSALTHKMKPPYNRTAHKVHIRKGTTLHRILGVEELNVNSYHHQAVHLPAPNLNILARADDNIVEALEVPNMRFAIAIQWHPEILFRTDTYSRKLVEAFVQSMR